MKDNKMKIIDNNGLEKEYEILVAFNYSKKNYIVYTDNTFDDEGNLNIYASIYNINKECVLEEIKTEEEWKIIEEKLKDLS